MTNDEEKHTQQPYATTLSTEFQLKLTIDEIIPLTPQYHAMVHALLSRPGGYHQISPKSIKSNPRILKTPSPRTLFLILILFLSFEMCINQRSQIAILMQELQPLMNHRAVIEHSIFVFCPLSFPLLFQW